MSKNDNDALKRPSITDGKWVLVLNDGVAWALPEGATLRRYDSKTMKALQEGAKPKDAFALSVVDIGAPENVPVDVEKLYARALTIARGSTSPEADAFLLLDEWLAEQKETGLPKAWRRDVFRSDALMGVVSELIRSFSEIEEVSAHHAPSHDYFLQFIQSLMDGVIPEVEADTVMDEFLKGLWPEEDPRWNLVKVQQEAPK